MIGWFQYARMLARMRRRGKRKDNAENAEWAEAHGEFGDTSGGREKQMRSKNRIRAVVGFAFACVVAVLLACAFGVAKSPSDAGTVKIEVHADRSEGAWRNIWNFWGYDEPNYTYAANGKKLLREFAELSPDPVYIRVHNLFTTGDGTPSLKWGSTNVYTEDASGKPIYDWTIVDRIFDTFRDTGVRPLVQLGFMPEALSTHPQPYRHTFPKGNIFTGWTYPPKDYAKWSDLEFRFAQHLRERYGDDEVKSWLWEVWNEPDIEYWHGTPEEYFKLYDFSVDAVSRALPQAHIGGPNSTGPGSPNAIAFLHDFLEHCAHGKNFANGKTGTRLDFVSFHPKGSPKWLGDHVQMGISKQLAAIDQGFSIVASFPEWKATPIILGESDPEGCAACSAQQNPQNRYRNGPLYASYTAEVLSRIPALAGQRGVQIRAAVNWSFEFEDQPPFAGFREMATNGIDKPVLNVFRMMGLLGGEHVEAQSSAALGTDEVLKSGVRGQADVSAIAARKPNEIGVLTWNYHDDDVAAPAVPVELKIDGVPPAAKRALIEHFRIDTTHSNAFEVWKAMGSPEHLSEQQLRTLESAGQLQLLTSPEWVTTANGAVTVKFDLPRQAVSLIRVTW
jgi:xylan 1,4-beta-xylosidase